MAEEMLSLERFLEEADSILNLFQHPGWKILQDEIKSRINSDGRRLVYSNDPAETLRLQCNLRALDYLVTFPRQFVEAANKAKQDQADQAAQATETPGQHTAPTA